MIVKITEVSASLLSAAGEINIPKLKERIMRLEECGIDSIHWDVMDGIYNPNNTIEYQGPSVIKELRKITRLPFVAHLMIANPLDYINVYRESGCDHIIFHYEACSKDQLKNFSQVGCGIAIEPDTPVVKIIPYLPGFGSVLIMTVKTGYSGQTFVDRTSVIRHLTELRNKKGLDFEIAVDGGINDSTAKLCREAGADVLVSASFITKHPGGFKKAIESLRG